MELLIEIIIFIVFLAIYLLPSIIAYKKQAHNFQLILLANILLGWSLIFWFWQMYWVLNYLDDYRNHNQW